MRYTTGYVPMQPPNYGRKVGRPKKVRKRDCEDPASPSKLACKPNKIGYVPGMEAGDLLEQ